MQHTCEQDTTDLKEKYDKLTVVVAIGTFICSLYFLAIRGLYQGGKIEQLDWDMATCTAADYTAEFPIRETAYEYWYKMFYQ